MIDENRIKQEIDNYVNGFELGLLTVEPPIPQKQKASLVMTMHNTLDFGLRRGQEMFLESLWHDASEEPRKGEKLLGFDVDGFSTYRWIDQEPTWKEFVYETVLQRWLYISDLIPKGGEK